MISVPEITLERIAVATDPACDLVALARKAVTELPKTDFGGVIAATFSSPDRFPSLAVQAASWLGLPAETPAFDLQMACSAYPYAVYLAGKLAADTGKKVLVIDGDVQTPLVDKADHATGAIFSDAVTATIVSADSAARSSFAFLSRHDPALSCPAAGPIRMDGFKVFTFVATEVSAFLRDFVRTVTDPNTQTPKHPNSCPFDFFVPHQANPYMIRQLADALGLKEQLVTLDESVKNPGSCSVPMAIAKAGIRGRALIAGFGAGYSAAAGIVNVL